MAEPKYLQERSLYQDKDRACLISKTKTMKNYIYILFLCFGQLLAQDPPRTVIGNAGDYYENLQFGNLHWTVGEVAVSLHQNGLELAEGFHQAYYELIVSTDDVLPDWEVNVFPNPTADYLQVKLPESEHVYAQLFGINGQLLISKEDISWETEFDLSDFPAGTYWLKLQDEDGRQRTFQVVKVRR